MKKRIFTFCLAICLAMMNGCWGDDEITSAVSEKGLTNNKTPTNNSAANAETAAETAFVDEDWGVTESYPVNFNDKLVKANIRVPCKLGVQIRGGLYAQNLDGTSYIISGYVNDYSFTYQTLPGALQCYEHQITEIFEGVIGSSRYADGSFVADSTEIVEINGYKMCKFTAVHSYSRRNSDWEKEYFTKNCVGYITELKGNGGIFFWILIDESEDSSCGDLLHSHADKMAHTLWEKVY